MQTGLLNTGRTGLSRSHDPFRLWFSVQEQTLSAISERSRASQRNITEIPPSVRSLSNLLKTGKTLIHNFSCIFQSIYSYPWDLFQINECIEGAHEAKHFHDDQPFWVTILLAISTSNNKMLCNPLPFLFGNRNCISWKNTCLTNTFSILKFITWLTAQFLETFEWSHGVDAMLSPLAGVRICYAFINVYKK